MGLNFGSASAQNVSHGSAAPLDSLSAWSVGMWVRFNAYPGFATWFHKHNGSSQGKWLFTDALNGGSFYIEQDRPTAATAATAQTANGTVTTGVWYWLVGTVDTAVSPVCRIYVGTLASTIAEVSYTSQIDGSGSVTDDSAGNLTFGGDPFGNSMGVDIALDVFWSKAISLAEARTQQFNISYPIAAPANCLMFSNYGYNGTGTQGDWSGNVNNGTVTNATVTAHVPIGAYANRQSPYNVAAAGVVGPLLRGRLVKRGILQGRLANA